MNTISLNQCPQCGQAISGGVKGLCPNCLAMIGFGAEEDNTSSHAGAGGTVVSAGRPLVAPTVTYFGDYELLDEIARGGMGVVFKARQKSLNRIVAVKMILGGQLATPSDVKRFRTEAEAAANLQHPNIVAIHETGEHEGKHYFSMDYVAGKNLAQVLNGQPMPAQQAAELLRSIAEAVHFAHQRGTLHRDLKPHNILIDETGRPRITDFGLARRVEQASELTQSGAVMGSPSYMPPEQATGKLAEIGPASDVYSLGAILYQLLTGQPPFAGRTALETLRQAMENEPVTPSKLNSQTPPDLETICLKCLEKRPERRYHSARELAEELGRLLNHETILARPATVWRKAWSWAQRNPWAMIGAAAAAGIVLLAVGYGLWEQVQYLQWKSQHPGPDKSAGSLKFGKSYDPHLIEIAGYLLMVPAIFFGRWLTARKQRNLPVSNLQLALLAGCGLSLVAIGLWSVLSLIQGFVWTNPFAWHVLVGLCLGSPLILCWTGSIFIWQAARRHQAHWSGSATVEEDWLPRQSLQYDTVAFVVATFANLVLFALLAYLTLLTAPFDEFFQYSGRTQDAYGWARMGFVFIAMVVSYACWVYATRKVQRRSAMVSILVWVLFGGSALVWFSVLPASFVVPPVLAGLLGGLVLVKAVKISKAEPAESLPPLVLDELFQWDRRALTISLAVVVIALGLLAELFFRKVFFMFLCLTVWTAPWPALFLAVRATTGKPREFFLSLLVAISIVVVGFPIVAIISGFKPTVIQHWIAITLIGLSAGCVLIFLGKIRKRR